MAKGISSEQALINLGNAYTLPEPPTMVALNHVILYPEFDLYDDPTANFAAFGVLAAENYDKPVVRVSAAGATLAAPRQYRRRTTRPAPTPPSRSRPTASSPAARWSATPAYSGAPRGQADRRCRTSAATMPRGFTAAFPKDAEPLSAIR